MIGRARTRLALVIGACAWLSGPGAVPTSARADGSCQPGKENAYMVWVDGVTSKMTGTEIPKELLRLATLSPASVAPAGLTMSTLNCEDAAQIARVRAKMPAFIHGLVDNRVLMAMFASGPDLEYYLFPYLLDAPTLPPRLTVRASCGPNRGEPTETIDAQRRTQAYAYAAAALYEIRQQESRPDACGSRRAEVLVQRALTFVGDLVARASIPAAAETSLLDHLKERCLVLERGIERMSRQGGAARPGAANGAAPQTSDSCGLPRASQQLAGLALDPNSVCGTSP